MTTRSTQMLDALMVTLRDGMEVFAELPLEGQELQALLDEIEATIVELVVAEPKAAARMLRSLEAQTLGLIELTRLTALQAKRHAIVAFIRGAISVVRTILTATP